MATFPVVSVRVAFATNPFDAVPTWTEIGQASGAGPAGKGWVRTFSTKRGRQRLLRSQSQFTAGTAALSLDNRDRRFDPTNTSGPYYPNVQPQKLLQIGATYSSVFYPIFTGYADDWPQKWPGFSEGEVALAATDFFKFASNARMLSAGYPKQVLADGPLAYYRLGEPAGSHAALDSTGNAHTATPAGGVQFGQPGALPSNTGSSALIPGNSSLIPGEIDLPAGIFAGTTGATIEFWVKLTSANGPVIYNCAGVFVFLSNTGLVRYQQNGAVIATGATPVNDGIWHHVVAVTTGAGVGFTNIYVDGNLDAAEVGGPNQNFPNVPASLGDLANGNNLDDMELQEVALYGTQLTGAQIAKHFSLGTYAAQFTGQMAGQVLDTIGFPTALRKIDTGHTFCQADIQDETQTKVLDQLQKLEQTEQGQLFVGPDGSLTFQDRYHRYESPNATSVATLGDGGAGHPSEVPYAMGGVILNFDWDELFNDVPVTRRGGLLQEAINTTSENEYTNRTMPGLSDLLMATDIDALGCAQFVLADTAFPQYRVGDILLDPTTDARLWPIVLGNDVGAVVTVIKHNIPGGGSLTLVCRIEGVEHTVAAPTSWKTVWHVSLAGTNPWFILNDPVTGLLDHGNRWGW